MPDTLPQSRNHQGGKKAEATSDFHKHDAKKNHGHLRVRSNGVIYTTADDLLSDPDVQKDIKGTTEVLKEVRDRKAAAMDRDFK